MRLFSVAAASCFCLALTVEAQAAGYTFTTIVDSNTSRPDGLGNFAIWPSLPPSLDNGTALIQNLSTNTCNYESVWSAPASGGSYTRLVALGDKAPGGDGAFGQLGPLEATAAGGIAAFTGYDQSGPAVYTIPLSGGKPSLVINYKSNIPSGPRFDLGDGCATTPYNMSLDGQHIAFFDHTFTTGNIYLLTATIGKKKIAESVDTPDQGNFPLSPRVPTGFQLAHADPNDPCGGGLIGGQGAPTYGVALSGKDMIFEGGSTDSGGTDAQLFRTGIDGFANTGETQDCRFYSVIVEPNLAYFATPIPGDPQSLPQNGFTNFAVDKGEIA